jgi:hypothetical protein
MTEPAQATSTQWTIRVNAILGSLVVTIGFWLIWGELPQPAAVALALGVAGFLVWRGTTVALIWAWTTLLLGLESLAWPVLIMVRLRMETTQPTDEQMIDMLTKILFGLFSAVFWASFSYGIFQRAKKSERGTDSASKSSGPDGQGRRQGKKKRRRR